VIALAVFSSLLLLGGYTLAGVMWVGAFKALYARKFWEAVYLPAVAWLWTGGVVIATWGTWWLWVMATVGL